MWVCGECESWGGSLMARVPGRRDRWLSGGLLASRWWCCLLELVLRGRGGQPQPPDSCFSSRPPYGFTPFFTHPAVHITLALLACAQEADSPKEAVERIPGGNHLACNFDLGRSSC